MKREVARRITFSTAFVFSLVFFSFEAAAFTGPSQPGGTGAGAIGVDAANNVSFGTSIPSPTTKVIIVASSTDTTNYGLRVVQPGGADVLVIRNDGNIGVGTGSPASSLDVQGAVTAISLSGQIVAENVSAGQFGANYGGGNYGFAGNVGFGLAGTPTHKIEFVSSTVASGGIAFGDVELYRSGVNTLSLAAGDLFNSPGGIFVAGNVVIGSTRYFYATDGSAAAAGYGFLSDGGLGMYRGGIDTLRFTTANTDRMTIDATGNVGIGTTGPTGRLHVAGGDVILDTGVQTDFYDETGDKIYWFSNTYGTGVEAGTITDWFATRRRWRVGGTSVSTGAEQMTLTATGLKLGGGDASYMLDVAGTGRFTGVLTLGNITGSTQCLQVDTNGNISGTGAACGSGGGGGGGVGTSTTPVVNAIPIWTSASQLGNSLLTQPTADTVAIGSGGLSVGTTADQSVGNITA
ncbi:hypothetical protein C4571_00250, partial [Candidatus Parcubacteria bacterium]